MVVINFTDQDTETASQPWLVGRTVALSSDGAGEHRPFEGMVTADQAVVLRG